MPIRWVFQVEDKSNYKELVSYCPNECDAFQVFELTTFDQEPIQLLGHQEQLVHHFQGQLPDRPFLLYWAMGTGKTIGVLSVIESIQSAQHTQVIIVCANTILDYWANTVKRMATGRARYRIVGYTEFRRRCIVEEFIGPDDVVIIDEAHHYRNLTPSMIQDVEYMKQGAALFLLTGTPIVNSIDDLRGLCSMMDIPHDQYMLDNIPRLFGNQVSYYNPMAHDLTFLKNHFPTLKRGLAKVPMTWRQTLEYVLEMKQSVTLGSVVIQSSKPNTYDIRSRLISNAPRVGSSPKLKYVVRNLLGIDRYPQVVYSHFRAKGITGVLGELNKRDHGLVVQMLTGSTASGKRQQIIQDYNDGLTDVLMITDAAKEGVDLHGTKVLHLVEPHYNLQSECQTMTRVIRYATDLQNEEVLVLKYVSTFPKSMDITPKDRVKLESYFCKEYLRSSSCPFDVVAELWKYVQKLEKTVDEKYEWNNIVKHEQIKPYLKQLQSCSSGKESSTGTFNA
ncbi:MAG: hypothetical protein K0U52_05270 [Gammaproteobacteria bacterium]|nr:hypothetical protein [Gammaproteobacteria bacterium]